MKKQPRFTLEQIVEYCEIQPEQVLRFVSFAWVEPIDSEEMIFDAEDVARIRLIYQLQEDMGVNDDGVPVVLHLVDQLNCMHKIIKARLEDLSQE